MNEGAKSYVFEPANVIFAEIVIHHRGMFVDDPVRVYLGGEISRLDKIDVDFISYGGICDAVKELGYIDEFQIYYRTPELDYVMITCDMDINYACEAAMSTNELHIYVNHGVSECIESQEYDPEIVQLSYRDYAQDKGDNVMVDEDEWFSQNMDKIDEVLGVKISQGNDSDDDSDLADSLIDVEPMTDDEEYISIRKVAEEIIKKKKVPNLGDNTEIRRETNEEGEANEEGETNEEGEANEDGEASKGGQPDSSRNADMGEGFKVWASEDEGASESEYDPQSSSEEEEWTRKSRKAKPVAALRFNPNVPIKEFDFCEALIFDNPAELKDQIRAYTAQGGYQINLTKNDKLRVQAKCVANCPWQLFASYSGKENTFMIKTYQKKHMRSVQLRVKLANSKWLAKKMGEQIRINPFIKLGVFKEMIKVQLGVDVNIKMCKQAKKRALDSVRESMKEHYSKLWNYVYELCRSNPGSKFILKQTDEEWVGPPKFRRIYICFDAVKRGFKNGCRKFIGVDGCFLKTWIQGELLSAVGKDANNQMYPIAWAVVEKEDQHTWAWFLTQLIEDLGMENGEGWTIISDQQKGLQLAVKNLLPEIHHRNCARHIFANFRKKYPGLNYRKHFWIAAKATTVEQFQKSMDIIKQFSNDAYNHLVDRDPSRWSRAFFPLISGVESVDNNMCEAFNSWILEARYKPLITMLEDIRKQVMVRMRDRRESITQQLAQGRKFGKRIYEDLEKAIKDSRLCTALWNGDSLYEIGGWYGGHTVDLAKWSCTCRSWMLSGIPCCHVVSAITLMRQNPEDYVSNWLKGDTYLSCYSEMMKPLNGMHMWPAANDKPILEPPAARKVTGRPQWLRRKDYEEKFDKKGKENAPENATHASAIPDPNQKKKVSRKGTILRCTICKETTHNRRTCPLKPQEGIPAQNQQRSQKQPVKRKTPDASEDMVDHFQFT